ncbi:hypothetical protein GCM10027592_56480 [Spirosoma flavus]
MSDSSPIVDTFKTVNPDLHLLTVLKQMVADYSDSDCHYMVSASYFDFVDSERQHTRQYMAPIYVHQDSAANIDFDEQGVLLDTFFSPEQDTPAERIRIPYDQIYRIARSSTGGLFTNEDTVYNEPSRFKMPPLR